MISLTIFPSVSPLSRIGPLNHSIYMCGDYLSGIWTLGSSIFEICIAYTGIIEIFLLAFTWDFILLFGDIFSLRRVWDGITLCMFWVCRFEGFRITPKPYLMFYEMPMIWDSLLLAFYGFISFEIICLCSDTILSLDVIIQFRLFLPIREYYHILLMLILSLILVNWFV